MLAVISAPGLSEVIVCGAFLLVPPLIIGAAGWRFKGAAFFGVLVAVACNYFLNPDFKGEKPFRGDQLKLFTYVLGEVAGCVIVGLIFGAVWYAPVSVWRRLRTRPTLGSTCQHCGWQGDRVASYCGQCGKPLTKPMSKV